MPSAAERTPRVIRQIKGLLIGAIRQASMLGLED
jgi:hypothetical protein